MAILTVISPRILKLITDADGSVLGSASVTQLLDS